MGAALRRGHDDLVRLRVQWPSTASTTDAGLATPLAVGVPGVFALGVLEGALEFPACLTSSGGASKAVRRVRRRCTLQRDNERILFRFRKVSKFGYAVHDSTRCHLNPSLSRGLHHMGVEQLHKLFGAKGAEQCVAFDRY